MPIPLTKEQEILDNLEDLLKTIKIVNGYRTDIGDRVLYQDAKKIEYTKDTVIFGESNEESRPENTKRHNELEISIECFLFLKGDASDRYLSTNAKADIIQAIGTTPSLGQGANFSCYKSSSSLIELEGKPCIKRSLDLCFSYKTGLWTNN
jgi:hypothetical protein